MFKKAISMILAAAMICSLTACGDGAKTGASGSRSAGGSPEQAGAEWPKNVEIIVPAGAGGDSDFNARLLAQKLSEKLPANFVVSNVNGNGGATGTRQVKDASNDGSSVLFYHTAFLVNKACGTTDYGFEAYDFASIAALNVGNVVTINSSLGISSLEELYNYTKEHPGQLKMAAQTGATSFAVAMQMKNAGFDVNIVDAGSAADRLAALLGGHVDIILAAYGSVKDYVQEGTLVTLAMDGEDDLVIEDQGIDIKAIHNLGYEDIKLPFYYFFAFPKGTDATLVQQFNEAVGDIVNNDAEYQDKIFTSYYQQSMFCPGEEGLAKYREIEELLKDVDFSAN